MTYFFRAFVFRVFVIPSFLIWLRPVAALCLGVKNADSTVSHRGGSQRLWQVRVPAAVRPHRTLACGPIVPRINLRYPLNVQPAMYAKTHLSLSVSLRDSSGSAEERYAADA